jgi:hypothetical protein
MPAHATSITFKQAAQYGVDLEKEFAEGKVFCLKNGETKNFFGYGKFEKKYVSTAGQEYKLDCQVFAGKHLDDYSHALTGEGAEPEKDAKGAAKRYERRFCAELLNINDMAQQPSGGGGCQMEKVERLPVPGAGKAKASESAAPAAGAASAR